jgi:transposase
MSDTKLQAIEQVRRFLDGSKELEFTGLLAEEKYEWVESVLVRFRYLQLRKDEKGVIRRYIEKITGYSRAQVSRLIRDYKQTGQLKKAKYSRHRFPRKYTSLDVKLLAKTDKLHGWLSGPATKKIMEREYVDSFHQIKIQTHQWLIALWRPTMALWYAKTWDTLISLKRVPNSSMPTIETF